MTRYRLSNRQRKELLVRGAELRIALPAPPEDADALAWSREVLPRDVAHMIVSADETELLVEPTIQVRRPETLTELLGAIVPETQARAWGVCVAAIVVTLRPADCRHPGRPEPQWPQDVIVEGRLLLGGDPE